MTQIEQLSALAEKVRLLRARLDEKRKLGHRIDMDKQNIRRALNGLGYRGPMPWLPARPHL